MDSRLITEIPLIGSELNLRNVLLRSFPHNLLVEILIGAAAVKYETSEVLLPKGGKVSTTIFPESGIMAIRAYAGKHALDIAYVGAEGVAVHDATLFSEFAQGEVVARSPGQAIAIPAEKLANVLMAHPEAWAVIRGYVQMRQTQLEQAALSASFGTVQARLARWILSYHARIASDEILCTHELLSGMLGVRRSSVTENLHILEGMRAISAMRGMIVVRDRTKLLKIAGDLYSGV